MKPGQIYKKIGGDWPTKYVIIVSDIDLSYKIPVFHVKCYYENGTGIPGSIMHDDSEFAKFYKLADDPEEEMLIRLELS
jgi:hypothetical protein